MLDFKNLKIGDEVKVINRVGNNVERFGWVKNGDIATVESFYDEDNEYKVELKCDSWNYSLFFLPHQIELYAEQPTTPQSEDLIIHKSRWDEIVESLEGGSNGVAGMTDEEVEIVKSVLKNNVPFNVANDPVIIDPIIEKEEQTHLDATHIGDTGNASLYYKSEILKKWFCWNEDYTWEECSFDYQDDEDLFPIAISK